MSSSIRRRVPPASPSFWRWSPRRSGSRPGAMPDVPVPRGGGRRRRARARARASGSSPARLPGTEIPHAAYMQALEAARALRAEGAIAGTGGPGAWEPAGPENIADG